MINRTPQKKQKQSPGLPTVKKSRLDTIFDLELQKQKEIRQIDSEIKPEKSMEQVINLYNQNYERDIEWRGTTQVRSPRLKKVKRNMVLALMEPKTSNPSPSVFVKDRFFTNKKSTIEAISNQKYSARNRRRELRKNVNLLIKKGPISYRNNRYCTDAAALSPNHSQSKMVCAQRFDLSLEHLKVKLMELQSMNSHSTIHNPESMIISNRKHHQRYLPKIDSQHQPPLKSKRYVDTTIDELCCNEQKILASNELEDYFFRVNPKILYTRPQIPSVNAVVRQYKSKQPLVQKYRSRQDVIGWEQQESTSLLR